MARQLNCLIYGAKGGGGGSSQTVTRTPDNLRSKDTVEAILGLCEGPIKGLKDGAKSFYVGDTTLQNQNGDYNLKAFMLKVYEGSDDPDPIKPVLGGSSANKVVNLSLESAVPVIRPTQSGQIDFIDVRLVFNRLFVSNDKGTFSTSATIRIETKPLSSSTWVKAYGQDITISGKTTSNYLKEVRIAVDRINEPYEIRVTKISAESDSTYFADFGWESYQETIAGDAVYPNTAVVHIVGEASDQFSSIPQWSGIYETKIVKVPTNYDPLTRTYTGVWDGTWQLAYTNNPAWCLYDFVMNDRFGIAYYYPEVNLDKYDVYDAAQWCDEMVPNGRGGFQPRYTLNIAISEARSGLELARYMAGVFNATFFDDLDGRAFLRVDKDDNPCHIFTQENVIDGNFEYSYTDINSRYNDITVTFKNPEQGWEEDRRRVKDQAMIDKNGPITLDFIAVGCIDFHEAIRRGQYKLITANTETCIVNFRTNRQGQFVNPFDVILVCDPDMGYGISGRAKTISESRTQITLRTPIYLEAGVSYNIQFTLSDGSFMTTNLIGTTKGYNTVLNFGEPLPEDNTPGKVLFTLEHPTLIGLPRPFRVTKVEEDQGNPDNYAITAININRNKWYDADNVTNSGVISYSVLPDPLNPPGPTAVAFSERFVKDLNQFHITISAVFDRGAYKYYSNDHSFEVWSRPKDGDEPYVRREVYWGDTLVDHPAGLYEFKILGKSYLGHTTKLESSPVYTFNVANPLDPPRDIDWVKINKREVYWGYDNPPDDFAGFLVRYHNQAGRTSWEDAIEAHQGVLSATQFYTNLIPPSARVIMVRPVDRFGVASVNSAVVYRDLGDITALNVVEEFQYDPTFSGTKVGCSVSLGALRATDTGGLVYSGSPTALFYDGGDMYESTYSEMIYIDEFSILSPGYLLVDLDFEGAGYELTIREQGETIWRPVPERMFVEAGDYEVSLRIFGGKTRGVIHEYSIIIDVDDVEEELEDLVVSSSGTLILPVTKNYTAIKKVSVTIQNDGSSTATTWRLLDKNPTGPEIELLNTAGTRVAGLIDATVKGYL